MTAEDLAHTQPTKPATIRLMQHKLNVRFSNQASHQKWSYVIQVTGTASSQYLFYLNYCAITLCSKLNLIGKTLPAANINC